MIHLALHRLRFAAILLGIALACAATLIPRRAHGEAAPIFLDGSFGDWSGPVELTDTGGDAGVSAVDFREVDLANDDGYLFIRFQTTVEVGIQGSNSLNLYIDSDSNAATGLAVGGIGAELQWSFGNRTGCFYPVAGCVTTGQNALRLRMLPSVTANTFEIAIGRDVRPDGSHLLFTSPTLRVLLLDSGSAGDRAPNEGGLPYTFDAGVVPPPTPIPFARDNAADVRVVTWNTRDFESGGGFDPNVVPSADRVLSAIAPNILCFQELYNTSASQVQSVVEDMLPLGGPWYGAKQNDCAVVSHYPVLQTWAIDGNLAVLLDTDAVLDVDLLLVCAHLPCCTNDGARQTEVDRIMSFVRDATTPGGGVDVPVGTALMIAGDLNLVGSSQQLRTLLTGDIANNATFGPDFSPDWDGTALADVVSSQTERRFAYSWRDDGLSFAPGRLDFVIFNDSVLGLGKHFIVYSPEMSASELAATGIQAGDVTRVSDHLPHVADVHPATDVVDVDVPVSFPSLSLSGAATLGAGAVSFVLELGVSASVVIDVHDVLGRRVASLLGSNAGPVPHGRHAFVWDARGSDGEALPSGVYFARAVARPVTGEPERTATARWVLVR